MYASQCRNISPEVPSVAVFVCKVLRTCIPLGLPPQFSLSLHSLSLVLLPARFPSQTLAEHFLSGSDCGASDSSVKSARPCSSTPVPAVCLCLRFIYSPFICVGCSACMYVFVPCACGGQNRGVISPRTGVEDSCEIPCGCSDPLAAQPVLLQLELN